MRFLVHSFFSSGEDERGRKSSSSAGLRVSGVQIFFSSLGRRRIIHGDTTKYSVRFRRRHALHVREERRLSAAVESPIREGRPHTSTAVLSIQYVEGTFSMGLRSFLLSVVSLSLFSLRSSLRLFGFSFLLSSVDSLLFLWDSREASEVFQGSSTPVCPTPALDDLVAWCCLCGMSSLCASSDAHLTRCSPFLGLPSSVCVSSSVSFSILRLVQ